MFSEEVMQRFSGTGNITAFNGAEVKDFPFWKDWLRGLRVMNGRGTVEMTKKIFNGNTNSNGGWQNLETDTYYSVSLNKTKKILAGNVFRFPEIEADNHTFVDPEYAVKFCAMMGKGEVVYAEPIRKHFLKRVKAAAEDYIAGNITIDEMPSIEDLLPVLSGSRKNVHAPLANKFDSVKDDLILDGVDYRPYFEVMPHTALNGEKVASKALSKESSFKLANITAANAGEFLKLYRESNGETLQLVGDRLGVTSEFIRQYEARPFYSDAQSKKILSRFNPYRLPIDDNGEIRTDVKQRFDELNIFHDEPILGNLPKLGKKEAFELASDQATSVGEFLKIYRQATGQTLKEVAMRINTSQKVMDTAEKRPKQPSQMMQRIISNNNPYQFPVDKSGSIRTDVVKKIRMLNSKTYSNGAAPKPTTKFNHVREEKSAPVIENLTDITEDGASEKPTKNYLNIINPISDFNGKLPAREQKDYIFRESSNDNIQFDDLDSYSASFGYELLTTRETKDIHRDDLAEHILRLNSEAVTVDLAQLRYWEQGRGDLPSIDEYKLLAQTLLNKNSAVDNKEKAAVDLFDAYHESRSGNKFRFADAITSLIEQMIGNGDIANRKELIQTINQISVETSLSEVEMQLLKRDKGQFIAAIEAGIVIPTSALTHLIGQALSSNEPNGFGHKIDQLHEDMPAKITAPPIETYRSKPVTQNISPIYQNSEDRALGKQKNNGRG